MASADVVVKGRFVADGSQAVPIEPRAFVAEWHGDRVQIWSSTQVPFAARALVSETLELPENTVRITVPHLGGGFGAKCEGHFEPQVAALAKAAHRPVKVVFSRREEFLAPDHRREGMVIELETGAMADGTVVARRGRLITENGAYSADEPLITQMALQFLAGPYRLPNVDIVGHCVYTNTQPSGSVRAPGAPQAAWALEQHMDELAAALGMDAVELRRKNLLRDGDDAPLGQFMDSIHAIETLDRAAELIGWGKPVPEGEAIGIACGWWPSFPMASGVYLKINGDGSPTIITGAQECGTGAVMTLPILAGEILGMAPKSFSLVYQDTETGPWDGGAGGSQTLFNNGRATVDAAETIRDRLLQMAGEFLEIAAADLELGTGASRRRVRPDAVRHDRLARLHGERRPAADRQGHRRPAADAGSRRHLVVHRPAGHGVLRRADVRHARRAHQGGPRDRRRSRPRGGRRPGFRRGREPRRLHGTGHGRRGHGHRAGAVRRHAARRRRPGPEPLPPRLQAADGGRHPGHPGHRDRHRGGRRGPEGLQGHRRAALHPDTGRDRERDRTRDGLPRPAAAGDAAPRVGGSAGRDGRDERPCVPNGHGSSKGPGATGGPR